ncbi:hypothetical protein BS50DRAFT_242351 [Corynespora cassiicola Philippines]|uniref:Uncharacterized protein n=1 Tax=Corynespora cassiicola Philippines TaxID=1448308 RepID=A0A2T2P2Z3_CORCC|nr:hypothetical protein BS50DRAFT_242351 [Corynespora cassiicola Philippines]
MEICSRCDPRPQVGQKHPATRKRAGQGIPVPSVPIRPAYPWKAVWCGAADSGRLHYQLFQRPAGRAARVSYSVERVSRQRCVVSPLSSTVQRASKAIAAAAANFRPSPEVERAATWPATPLADISILEPVRGAAPMPVYTTTRPKMFDS